MSRRRLAFRLFLAGFVAWQITAPMAFGQGRSRNFGRLARELGWDLTYSSLLKKNHVGPDEFISKWLDGTDRAYTSEILGNWPRERISASVLIEAPAFHAGEHVIMWFIRTDAKAFVWQAVDRGSGVKGVIDTSRRQFEKKEIDPKRIDEGLKSISKWEQAEPKPIANGTDQQRRALSGYIGFLNYYDQKGPRQLLLTVGDFHNGAGGGRLRETLQIDW